MLFPDSLSLGTAAVADSNLQLAAATNTSKAGADVAEAAKALALATKNVDDIVMILQVNYSLRFLLG